MKKITILLFTAIILALALGFAYQTQIGGDAKTIIQEHGQFFLNNTIPSADTIDIENDPWVQVAKLRSNIGYIGFFTGILFTIAVTSILVFGGISKQLSDFTKRKTERKFFQRVYYLILITLIGSLISLPLTLLGFYVSRLFGLATLSIGLWTKDFLMSLGLAIVFTLIIYLPLYWLMEKFQRTWWLWISLLAIPFTILMQVLVPFVITPLFNTQRPLDDSALSESITTMTREAGVPIENLFIINDSRRSISANAMVTGFGASKRIVFSDNLLSHYTADEIVFITAHELGHYVKHHVIYRMILNIVSICVMFFLLYRILHWFVRKYGTQLGVLEVHDISLFPLLGLIMSLLGLLIAPGPLALSRSVERQADTYALSITHNPEGGIGAFKKLSFQSFGDPSPSAIRQFWFGGHPTIKERIETLKGEK